MRKKDFKEMYGKCVQFIKSVYNTKIFQTIN